MWRPHRCLRVKMDQLELYQERLAIMEFDGDVPRNQLERLAGLDARDSARRAFPFLPMIQSQARAFKNVAWSAGKAVRLLAREYDGIR